MRFFSNDARETNDDHPDRPVDDSAAVPEQRLGSPWSATPTDSPDTPGSAADPVDRSDGKVDEQDSDSVETRSEADAAKTGTPEADTEADAEAEADAPFAATPVEPGSDATTYASAAASDDTVADRDDTVTEDPMPADAADSATAVAAVPVAAVAAVPVAAVAAQATSEPAKPGSVPEKNLDSLFGADSAKGFQERWREVQLRFVDSPKDATAEAAGLVDEAVEQLTESLKAQKDTLLSDSDDTEKLRLELRGYRDILNRILSL